MAKDTRKKRQVALAEEKSPAPTRKKRKKKNTPARVIVKILLAVFVIMLFVFLYVVGRYIYSYFKTDDNTNAPIPVDYETTADSELSKVSYYLVGLMGESSTDPLSMLSLVCFDKKAGTLDVLQLPVSTYLGKTEGWEVTTLAKAWSSPQSLTWCDRCRKRVFEPEVGEKNTHSVCGEALSSKKGSATENLIDICNAQFSMPVDAFFILPRASLTKLVDSVGGVDVELSAAITVDGTKYGKGKQTLDGKAALYYAVSANYKDNVVTDLTRMEQQRQVFTALLWRMNSLTREELLDKVIDPIMSGSTPIRVTETLQSRRAMMAGLTNASAESVDNEDAMCYLLEGISKLQPEAMRYHLLPGESVKKGSDTVFGVHKAETLTLLGESFNPYGRPITEADVKIDELKNSGTADTKTVTFAEVAPPQQAAFAPAEAGE